MRKVTFAAIAVLGVAGLGGCASMVPQMPIAQVTTPVDEVALAAFGAKGTGKIVGQAFLKTRGGDVKPCAGERAALIPSTPYTTEWFEKAVVQDRPTVQLDPRAQAVVRTEVGDGQGNFVFAALPAGSYYVVCRVTWSVPTTSYVTRTTGGWAFAAVTLAVGDSVRVIATDRTPEYASLFKASPAPTEGFSSSTPPSGYEAVLLKTVRLRYEAGSWSELGPQLKQGTRLTVEREQKEWRLVRAGEERGWVKADEVEALRP